MQVPPGIVNRLPVFQNPIENVRTLRERCLEHLAEVRRSGGLAGNFIFIGYKRFLDYSEYSHTFQRVGVYIPNEKRLTEDPNSG